MRLELIGKVGWICCLTVLAVAETVCAEPGNSIREGFNSDLPSWTLTLPDDSGATKLLAHRRHQTIRQEGAASEYAAFEVRHDGAKVQLLHPVTPARVIDDLHLSLWFKSNQTGAAIWLRVVLPHHNDPESGEPIKVYMRGDTYTAQGNRWQQLHVATPRKDLISQLVLQRARWGNSAISARDSFVDRVVITAKYPRGPVEMFIDDLQMGPIVAPDAVAGPVVQAGNEEPSELPVQFRLDQLEVQGRPVFPRIVKFHGEQPQTLVDSGANTIWIPNIDDERLMNDLTSRNLWLMATPPRPKTGGGEELGDRQAGLPPFDERTKSVLFWNLGSQVRSKHRTLLMSWLRQVRSADRKYQRPVTVDVINMERTVSREVPILGISRHMVNTSTSFREYRDWLSDRGKLATPGSFLWTWIQTESSRTNSTWREQSGKGPIVIEPEQIAMQVYSAIAAGCRGVGFWKRTPLDGDQLGHLERRLIMSQLALEIELLEPWLATGSVVEQVPFEVQRNPKSTAGDVWSKATFGLGRQRAKSGNRSSDHEATVIRSDLGTLLVPMWYHPDAQFVPAPMVANDVSLVVPGVEETASAWEVTTTGIRSLPKRRVAGGVEITLKRFDQFAMIILTSNQKMKFFIERKIKEMDQRSARITIDLAMAKSTRVQMVNRELQEIGVPHGQASVWLATSARSISQAETSFESGDFDESRKHARQALQFLRMLQYSQWKQATAKLTSPTSSPFTICYQSLPDHWRMVQALGQSDSNDETNLLRSGDFEDYDTMMVEGWKHAQNPQSGIAANARLDSVAKSGRYSLRLWAVPDTQAGLPTTIDRSPVLITTPGMKVRNGQVVHVGGWIRVKTSPALAGEGVLVYDNLTGRANALRWNQSTEWQRFHIIREIPVTGELELTLELTGLGEVQFDDLRVIPHNPRLEQAGNFTKSLENEKSDSGPLKFLQRLPKLRPPLSRKTPETTE